MGQAMGFSINSKDAGPGQLYVRCQGPSKDCDCTVFDNKDSTYQVQIFPSEVGNHLVYVEWGGRPVHGSPFLVRVGQPPDPSKVRVYGTYLCLSIFKLFSYFTSVRPYNFLYKGMIWGIYIRMNPFKAFTVRPVLNGHPWGMAN